MALGGRHPGLVLLVGVAVALSACAQLLLLRDRTLGGSLLLLGASTPAVVSALWAASWARRSAQHGSRDAFTALAESEQRYRSVVDSVKDVIFTIDDAGAWSFLNQRWADLTGYPVTHSLGQPFDAHLHPADRGESVARVRQVSGGRMHEAGLEVRFLRADGSAVWVDMWVSRRGHDARTYGTLVDVTERRRFEEELQYQALHDPLTGLANRTLLTDHLEAALARAQRGSSQVAILFLDLDRFKVVNDSLGHDAGDELLVQVAGRLRDVLRPHDTAARLGGDEFVIVCEGLETTDDAALAAARQVSERLERAIARSFDLGGHEVYVTASVGITLAHPGVRVDALLAEADAAMYRAKELGKGRHEVFDDVLRLQAESHLALERDLRHGLERDEFTVFYQPILDCRSGELAGLEALLRWDHPLLGRLAPDVFLDIAEDAGLMPAIGRHVIERACADAARWRGSRPDTPLTVAVNLSARQLAAPGLLDHVRACLVRHGLPATALSVEVTENEVLDSHASTIETLVALSDLGCRIAMDDFGTGYSSLSFLRRLPIDVIKIDRTFIDRLGVDEDDAKIVGLVVSLGRALGMQVVAEGVERPSQVTMLRDLGCDLLQGYLLGRPAAAEKVDARLAEDAVSV